MFAPWVQTVFTTLRKDQMAFIQLSFGAVTWLSHGNNTLCVSKRRFVLVHQRSQMVGCLVGRWGRVGQGGRWVGGVSVLPRAQGWCGRALGSSGTWLALEFYCEPARAWHSHENGYGRTEGRKEGKEERKGWKIIGKGGGSRREKQMQGGREEGSFAGKGRVVGAARFIFVVFGCLQGEQFKSRLAAGFEWQGKKRWKTKKKQRTKNKVSQLRMRWPLTKTTVGWQQQQLNNVQQKLTKQTSTCSVSLTLSHTHSQRCFTQWSHDTQTVLTHGTQQFDPTVMSLLDFTASKHAAEEKSATVFVCVFSQNENITQSSCLCHWWLFKSLFLWSVWFLVAICCYKRGRYDSWAIPLAAAGSKWHHWHKTATIVPSQNDERNINFKWLCFVSVCGWLVLEASH